MLLVLVVITTCLAVNLHARFATEGEAQDSARVAGFVLTKGGKQSKPIGLSDIKKPGDKATYTFTVSNSNANGSVVSEVALKCLFEVRINGSMPLVCTIREKDAAESDRSLLTAELTENSASSVEVWEEGALFAAATRDIKTYVLTVTWPEDKNDAKYASHNAVAEVKLTVKAEQID
ncbi:hypothetical protein [Adlercreutzia sp. ZJ242]|uniref:hypothetical protein n=1 Tax=Adlercreutzia sp. ZJ242 TaxID=2709409 RepID=UPI00197CC1C2|nr:hypothetical protein [Adlercreutzia sp. ZJ242]